MKKQSEKADPGEIRRRHKLGIFSSISYVICTAIGSGIFISPIHVLDKVGSVGLLCPLAIHDVDILISKSQSVASDPKRNNDQYILV